MTVIPGVRYAKSDDFLLAYQVVGEGARDLVYLQFETPTVGSPEEGGDDPLVVGTGLHEVGDDDVVITRRSRS